MATPGGVPGRGPGANSANASWLRRHGRTLLLTGVVASLMFSTYELGRRFPDDNKHVPPRHGRPGFDGRGAHGDSNEDPGVDARGTVTSLNSVHSAVNAALREFEAELCDVERFKTHLSTDKPIYRPGDTLRLRGVVLRAGDLTPLIANKAHGNGHVFVPTPSIEVKGPKGDVVATMVPGRAEASSFPASWVLPADLPGGDYVIEAKYGDGGYAPAQRTFSVQSFTQPQLRLQLKFARDGYGPGDRVTASLTAFRGGGAAAEGAAVSGVVRLDGEEVWRGDGARVAADGASVISFELPADIERGEGSLTAVITDGATVDSTSKTVPIVLSDLDIALYPESGDLVAGLPTRVYAEATAPNGRPADFEGDIVEVTKGPDGAVHVSAVARVATMHEGRGVSDEFTPREAPGLRYELRVSRPATVRRVKPLPDVKGATDGLSGVITVAAMEGGAGVLGADEPLHLRVGARVPGHYRVGVYRREVEIANQYVDLPGVDGDARGAMKTVLLTPARTSDADGVLRVTLFDAGTDVPLAERLVFRKPRNVVNVDVTAAPSTTTAGGVDAGARAADADAAEGEAGADASLMYAPGDPVTLKIKTTDATGGPVAAVVGVTITDDTVLNKEERRKWAPRLPAMALLEDEVAALADSDAYLSDVFPRVIAGSADAVVGMGAGGKPVAPSAALDLLLGTQGWRRFVYRNPLEYLGPDPDAPKNRGRGIGNGRGDDDGAAGDGGGAAAKTHAEYTAAERLLAVHRSPPVILLRAGAMPMMANARGMPKAAMFGGGAPEAEGMMMEPEMALAGAAAGAPGGPDDGMAFAMPAMAQHAAMAMPEPDMAPAPMPAPMGAAMDEGREHLVAEAPMPPMAPPAPVPMDPGMGMPPMEVPPMAPPDVAMDMDMGDVRAKRMPGPGERFMPRPAFPMMPQREYAHPARARKAADGDVATRSDFTETVYWHAGVPTDATTGEVTITFSLSDSVTTLRVLTDGYQASGPRNAAFGAATHTITVVEPFYAELKVPTEVTAGDRLSIPLSTTLVNAKGAGGEGVPVAVATEASGPLRLTRDAGDAATWVQTGRSSRVFVEAVADMSAASAAGAGGGAAAATDGGKEAPAPAPVPSTAPQVGPGGAVTATLTVAAYAGTGAEAAAAAGTAGASQAPAPASDLLTDSLTRTLRVAPGGFPVEEASGGMISQASPPPPLHVTLPAEVNQGSLAVQAHVYPSPVASLTQALEALIQRPCGCFEQTSATTYPLVMAQKYFKTHTGVDADLVSRADAMLREGYAKLTSFESEGGGFEWFGGTPAHEALTAYGALQFQDMADVFDVDAAMLRRTQEWLRGRRDGSGGFLRSDQALDSFGRASPEVTNAYIVWSLTSAGDTSLAREVDALLAKTAEATTGTAADDKAAYARDPYFVGLVAGSLYNVGRVEEARALAQRLASLQDSALGVVPNAKGSITCSGGASLDAETTAVAILAWLQDDATFADHTRLAMEWLVSQCQNGRFGSTQATVLALKAIVAYDVARAAPKGSGEIQLLVDGTRVQALPFDADTKGALTFDGGKAVPFLAAGSEADVALVMTSTDPDASMPFSLQVTYNTPLPPSAPQAPIGLSTSLSPASVAESEVTELTVTVTNNDKGAPAAMTIAEVGIPGGLDVRVEKLRELRDAGRVAFFETTPRKVVLYWRGMAPGQSVTVPIELVAAVPGSYAGDASSAYLYYTDELKAWQAGVQVHVTPA